MGFGASPSLSGSQLSDDVLVEIISRLPAKSLLRFKCVSKAWCAFISAESFQRKLILSLSGLFYGVCVNRKVDEWGYAYVPGGGKAGDGDFPDMSLRFLPGYPNISILDSRNGLVLCLCGLVKGQTPYYSVCNPLTKRWVSVSLPEGFTGGYTMRYARLAFDPSASIHFRIVLMPRPFDNPPGFVLLQVYSSHSANWDTSGLVCNDSNFAFSMEDAIFLNEHLYVPSFVCHLMRINLVDMSCQTIKLNKMQHRLEALGVYDGRLYCAKNDGFQLTVWMLENFERSSWSSKDYCSRSGLFMDDLEGLAFHPDIRMIFVVTHCKIFSYDLYSTRVEEICSFTCNASRSDRKFVFPFTPCLSSVVDGSLQRTR